jgi:23S rRNA pseudouridine2604 synthase
MKVTEEKEIRLNAYLSKQGIASRRGADTLIEAKKISVNGVVATLGTKVRNGDEVLVLGATSLYYILFNKKAGTILDSLPEKPTTKALENLEKEESGLILFSNDHSLLRGYNKLSSVYAVTVKENLTERIPKLLVEGVSTQEGTYKAAHAELQNEHMLEITLVGEKKAAVKRMLNALLLTPLSLRRISVGNLKVNNLKETTSRELSEKEILELKNSIQ